MRTSERVSTRTPVSVQLCVAQSNLLMEKLPPLTVGRKRTPHQTPS